MPKTLVSPSLPDRPLIVDEVAEYLHLCKATVRREAHRGNLRGYKVAGNSWRFHGPDVEAYLSGGAR